MRNICDISNLRRWIVVIVCACTAAGCNKSNDHAPLPSETPSSNAPVAAAADSAKQEAVAVSSDTKAKPPRRRKKKKFPRNLSEFGLFEGNIAELKPAESVVQYDVNTPSFADYAVRHRVIRLP
ncbi:MAG: hypothetical protein KDB27_06665, partial [Planctomycetales bacterium]|nr:hypothetical protein [Planctomycetales bacterium]